MSNRLVRVLLLAATALVMLPAVLPYTVAYAPGTDPSHEDKVCIALKDAWHADRTAPSADDMRLVQQHLLTFSPPQHATQAERAAFVAQQRSWNQQPAVRRVNAYTDWLLGQGACVPQGRHRLIVSWIGLVIVAATAITVAVVALRRKSRAGLQGIAESTTEPKELLVG